MQNIPYYKKFNICLFLCIFLLATLQAYEDDTTQQITELETEKVIPVYYEKNIEPSGLTFWQGHLLTVDDETNNIIFEIVIEENKAIVKPFIYIKDVTATEKLDMEGITSYKDKLYIASEEKNAILEVDQHGNSQWLPIDIKSYGSSHQLLTTYNATIEGIASLENNRFLLAAEREPRALIELSITSNPTIEHQLLPDDDQILSGISPDLSALFYYDAKVWGLFRGKNQIVQFSGNKIGEYKVEKRYSFRHVFSNPNNAYQEMFYGLAEGLAIDKNYFYIILDNNGKPHRNDINDCKPMLIILKKPLQ